MIVEMKKAAVITREKDAPAAIESLRSLGILHIEHQNLPKGEDIDKIKEDIAALTQALNILSLSGALNNGRSGRIKEPGSWRLEVQHILDSYQRLNQLEEYSRRLKEEIREWEAWGDFNPREIEELAKRGIYLRLYRVPKNELGLLPENTVLKKVSYRAGIVNCAVISEGKIAIPFKEEPLPGMSLFQMRLRLSQDTRAIIRIKEDLSGDAAYYQNLIDARQALGKELEFQEVLRGKGLSCGLAYLSGYLPSDTVNALTGTAKKEGWAVAVTEPEAEDNVPTLIRNNRWVCLVQPVMNLLGIIPGYRELDISLCFLVFFSVFFGILIGDAGYGLIYLGLTRFLQRKFAAKFKDNSPFALLYLLSACAIIWGVLNAAFFGQEWLSGMVRPLVPALKNDKNMQGLCFFLGALHLSIAHLWRSAVKLPSLRALSDIGWVLILWGSFLLARALILGAYFPPSGKILFLSGAILVILFTARRENILKGALAGGQALLLSAVNTFTDVVSYIRLFAVGLAGAAVADAFNQMASSLGFGSLMSGFLASAALFCGHGLNILLGPLSILVHGARLNVLEFSSHADVKWSGFAYRPFK